MTCANLTGYHGSRCHVFAIVVNQTSRPPVNLIRTYYIFMNNMVTFTPSESKRCRCTLSQKHLRSGDIPPPHGGSLRIFAMRFCPYSHRSILVLKAKKLPHDIVYINLHYKPDWLYTYSPKGTVPALEYEAGDAIYESSIINAYLDERYPDPPLQSDYPLRRAQDRIVLENFSRVHSIYMTAAFNPEDLEPKDSSKFLKALDQLQRELAIRETTFFFGNEPGLVDYNMWPFLERLESLTLLGNTEFVMSAERYSLLLTYMEAMKRVPAVKAYYLSPEIHAEYIANRRDKGDTNYNMLENSPHCCTRQY